MFPFEIRNQLEYIAWPKQGRFIAFGAAHTIYHIRLQSKLSRENAANNTRFGVLNRVQYKTVGFNQHSNLKILVLLLDK